MEALVKILEDVDGDLSHRHVDLVDIL